MNSTVLIIDPQRDFTVSGGALYVNGADKDMERLSSFVSGMGFKDIFVTKDSHRTMHIAHPAFWTDASGGHPEPFTVITFADVKSGRMKAVINPEIAADYLRRLEERGKRHTVWKPHCIMGTDGYEIHGQLKKALVKRAAEGAEINIVHKGDCLFAEHFSALKAEVENDLFPETKLNTALINRLKEYESVFLAGECADICVKETLRDLTEYAPSVVAKLKILGDCMSPLNAQFAFQTDEVYRKAVAMGAEITASDIAIVRK